MNVNFDHLRYIEPQLKSHLVECAYKIATECPNLLRQGEAYLQLSMALTSGLGTDIDADKALEYMIKSATLECIRAQALVKRLHCSFHQDVPSDLPIEKWLIAGAETGSVIAQHDLKTLSPELFIKAIGVFRIKYCGIGRPLFDIDTGELEANTILNDRLDTPLHRAAMCADTEVVDMLLEIPSVLSTIDKTNKYNETALFCACRSGNSKIVEALLHRGASAAIVTQSGEGPLHWLASFPDDEIRYMATLLWEHGTSLENHAEANGSLYFHHANGLGAGTPLTRAVARGSQIAVQCLLDLGSSPLHDPPKSSTIIARQEHYLDGDWLSGKDIRANSLTSIKQWRISPLNEACITHRTDITALMVSACPVETRNCVAYARPNYSALENARDRLYFTTLKYLGNGHTGGPMDSDAFERLYGSVYPEFSILYFTCLGASVFERRILHGDAFGVRMSDSIDNLVEAGADMEKVSKFGSTAVFTAVEGCNIDIVDHLLANYLSCVDHLGNTYTNGGGRNVLPLHYAIIQDSKQIFDLLLYYGAPLDGGIQACAIANHKSLHYVRTAITKNASPAPHFLNGTPVVLALWRSNIALASLLVEHFPELLNESGIKQLTVLDGMILKTALSARPDFRSLDFIIDQWRIYDIHPPNPPLNDDHADPLMLALVSGWAHSHVEKSEADYSHIQGIINRVVGTLLRAFPGELDTALAVDIATVGRRVSTLRILLNAGAGCNYCKKVGNFNIGRSTMDAALQDQKTGAPAWAKAAGPRAEQEYVARTEEIVQLLRQHGAQTHFEMRGWELYGERTGFMLFGGGFTTLLDDMTSGWRGWKNKTQRAVDRNMRYW
jgi:hypothetical protein